MHLHITLKVLGILLMLFSVVSNLPSMLVSLIYDDGSMGAFVIPLLGTFGVGCGMFLATARSRQELRTRDGFLVVTLFWSVLGTVGCLPLLFAPTLDLGVTDAIFESMSGLTTTGATVLTGIDSLPKSILFYRQQLQWLGGMGIVALAVAVLPMLGIGGMQLYRAEFAGPVKDAKLVPRLAETAQALWYIYLSLTVACTLAYWLAGMTLFDAICHSFATVAIGGFSTHDASLGYFDNPAVMVVATVFMIFAGINFALHFTAWRERGLRHYLADEEVRFYLFVLALVAAATVSTLIVFDVYDGPEALLTGVFHTVSIATTTGFTTTDFSAWPTFVPYMLFYAAIVGGCAGSTAGGMKVIRVLLIFKQGLREVKRLIHPRAEIPIKLGRTLVSDRVVESVWGFFSVYVMVYMALLLILLAEGLDIMTAFSAVGACINNLGPGLAEVAMNYGHLSDLAKWTLCVAMLLGRLEVFTLLVLLTPTYWRK